MTGKAVPGDPKKKAWIIISLVAILLAGWSIIIGPCLRKPERSIRPIREAGQFVAGATARALGGKGSVVLIAMDNDHFDAQAKAFRKALEKHEHLRLLAREDLDATDLAMTTLGSAPSPDAFFRIYQKHRTVAAIVSMVGPPVLARSDYSRLDPEGPQLIVFAPMGFGVKTLLEDNVIHVAIVPQAPTINPPGSPGVSTASTNPEPYQVVTPDTVDALRMIEPPPLPVPKK